MVFQKTIMRPKWSKLANTLNVSITGIMLSWMDASCGQEGVYIMKASIEKDRDGPILEGGSIE